MNLIIGLILGAIMGAAGLYAIMRHSMNQRLREEITRIRAQPRPAIEAPRAITRLTNRRRTVEL